MPTELNSILENLHSDEARLAFLTSIYLPGDADVADKILTMGEDCSVIEKEMNFAKTSVQYLQNFQRILRQPHHRMAP